RPGTPAAATWHGTPEAMLGQLRAAASDASRLAEVRAKTALITGRHVGVEVAPDSPGQRLAVVRANANLGSEAGRHALRLAVVAGLAELLVQATGVEEGRWVVLTVFLVLKPDYSTTLPRGVQRA